MSPSGVFATMDFASPDHRDRSAETTATLRSFSFALLVGILVGTYSSIFIASGLLAEWWNKVPQKG